MSSEKQRVLVTADEENSINRNMLVWLNTFPDSPVDTIRYNDLPSDATGMALALIQSAYITRRYITGGYQAEYQFKVIYRIKPGESIDRRLKADELLDSLGDWAQTNKPNLGGSIRVLRIDVTSRSALYAIYEGGDEDHQILMKMTYEVI